MKKLIAIFLILTLSACGAPTGSGDQPRIEVQDAWARASAAMAPGSSMAQATPGGHGMEGEGFNSAAYMVLKNSGGVADRLIAAKGDAAEAIELHLSEMKDGVMKMHPVEFIEVPAGGQAELKPGSYHIMLISLKQDLKPGDRVKLTLVFEKAGEIPVEAEVRAP